MDKINIGIIGCGNISGIYLTNLTQTFANTRVVACSDLDLDRAAAAAEQHGIPHALGTSELLAREDIQIVVNLTTPKHHYEVSKLALLAGKHVYVESRLPCLLRKGRRWCSWPRKRV